MKTSIIHLTDIHMDDNWDFNNFVKELSLEMSNIGADNIIVCISGDLTQSGKKEQYDRVYTFIESLKNQMSNICKVDIAFVPGNHDIEYQIYETRDRDIQKNLTDEKYFDEIENEMTKFSNFYSFADLYNLPTHFISNNRLMLEHFDCDVGNDIKMRFYLLNNVTFSTYKAKNDENSVGAVHIPMSLFESIKMEPNTVNFLLMHFPDYYLDEETYSSLKRIMPRLSYILCGHIHESEYVSISCNDNICSISISPALYKGVIDRMGASVLIFDNDNKEIVRYAYKLSANGNLIKESTKDKSFARIICGLNPIMKNADFSNRVLFPGYDNISLSDYFVFPELYSDKAKSLEKIVDLEALISCLKKKGKIIIKGASQSGKTSLLSKLFFDLDSCGIPVYFEFNKEMFADLDSFDRLIDLKLNEEYSDRFARGVFNTRKAENRIALIDNFVIDRDSKKILDNISHFFGKVIIASAGTSYGTTELEKMAINSILDESIVFYEIRPMFEEKRYELVEKRYYASFKNTKRIISDDEVKIFYKKVQLILDKYVGTDAKYPYFINKVIASVLDDNISLSTQNNRMYSRVYETYMGTILHDIFKNQEDAIVAQELLKVIANSIIQKESYKIEYSEFHKLASEFFNDKKITSISIDDIVKKLLDKKILVCVESYSYAFGSYDFLSYFAARYFSDLLNDDFENNKIIINNYLEKAYDDVISKFMLFVVSLATKKTALYLIKIAEDFIAIYDDYEVVYEEMALNDKEFTYLHRLTKKDRQILRERVSEKEAERYESEKKEYKKTVDEGKREITDQDIKLYFKCMGLLDIVSAMLPDLKVVLNGEDQDRCIRIIYKLPLILYRLAIGPISDNFDAIAKKLKEILEKYNKVVSFDAAKSIVIDYCRASFLALIDHTMRRAHTKLTEKDLRKKDFADNDTKKLIRLMTSLHDENAEETFEKYAKDYFEFFRANPFAKNCISLMVRNYVSWYLSEEKAISKREFLRIFLKDSKIVEKTIESNLKGKKDNLF